MVKYHNYQLKWWKEGITLLRTFTFVIRCWPTFFFYRDIIIDYNK